MKVIANGTMVLNDSVSSLRDVWEATSFQLERLQANPVCVEMEEENLKLRKAPQYKLTFSGNPLPVASIGT
jgi:phosphoribosylformylglycinamidine synthase